MVESHKKEQVGMIGMGMFGWQAEALFAANAGSIGLNVDRLDMWL